MVVDGFGGGGQGTSSLKLSRQNRCDSDVAAQRRMTSQRALHVPLFEMLVVMTFVVVVAFPLRRELLQQNVYWRQPHCFQVVDDPRTLASC